MGAKAVGRGRQVRTIQGRTRLLLKCRISSGLSCRMKPQSKAVAPARREAPLARARRRSRTLTDQARNRASGVIFARFRPPPPSDEPRLAARREVAPQKVLDIVNFINLSGWTGAALRR
jgi:hypothetical protein